MEKDDIKNIRRLFYEGMRKIKMEQGLKKKE